MKDNILKKEHSVITKEISDFLNELFPIHRSLTGEGNRETLRILNRIIPLKIKEFGTGQKVFDWTVPKEWKVKDAWIKNQKGEKVIDLKKNNLHIVSYSVSIHRKMYLDELLKHLHFLEGLPDAIPFCASYYKENWGFSLSYEDFLGCFDKKTEYEVFIDSELKNGTLPIGEFLIKGKTKEEIVISAYICHPSMANDNLSGIVLAAFLARALSQRELNKSYRILFAPETIGTIAFLSSYKKNIKNIRGALVVTCVAGPGKMGYKETFLGNSSIDKAIVQTFKEKGIDYARYPFVPEGSDERQYSSPGLRIPAASIFKDKYHEYKEYHTSLDDLSFISAEYLLQTLDVYLSVIEKIDKDKRFISLKPCGEPFLSKYDLYPSLSMSKSTLGIRRSDDENKNLDLDAVRWVLFYADGKHSLLDMADKTGLSFGELSRASQVLEEKGLIREKVQK